MGDDDAGISTVTDPSLFRTAMSRLGAAVNLVTTNGPSGRYGIVASAVCSVTDSPPTLLVCVNRSSGANAAIKSNGVLCVNILSGRHQDIATQFQSPRPDARFDMGEWVELQTRSPVLADAAAALDCTVVSIQEVGSHSVFFAEATALRVNDAIDGLIWFDRRHHHLT